MINFYLFCQNQWLMVKLLSFKYLALLEYDGCELAIWIQVTPCNCIKMLGSLAFPEAVIAEWSINTSLCMTTPLFPWFLGALIAEWSKHALVPVYGWQYFSPIGLNLILADPGMLAEIQWTIFVVTPVSFSILELTAWILVEVWRLLP